MSCPVCERAATILEVYGVPRLRARTVPNGIEVLVARGMKERIDRNLEILHLKEQLRRFGAHDRHCAWPEKECDCGFQRPSDDPEELTADLLKCARREDSGGHGYDVWIIGGQRFVPIEDAEKVRTSAFTEGAHSVALRWADALGTSVNSLLAEGEGERAEQLKSIIEQFRTRTP